MKKFFKTIKLIFNIILIILACIIITKLWKIYKINDFDEFIKAEYVQGVSEFVRDEEVRYSEANSYKIISEEFNEALIYKNIKTEKETPYRVSAMVKYENVQNETENTEAGVNIGIMDTIEKSKSYIGTSNGWQKISFEFNSKNRENVDLVFRLGSYEDNSKGTVWFSDFQIEKGEQETDSNWNFAFFIINNIDVEIEENGIKKQVKMELSKSETQLLKDNLERFAKSMKDLSGNLMTATYKLYDINTPITSITYSEEHGYYITAKDVKNITDPYVENEEFDHIFVAYKLGEELHKEKISDGGDWIGLRRNGIWK